MSHCLCIYYSRTGNTRAVMGKIAELLDEHGKELPERVAYVITHMGDSPYETVYQQMDQYLSAPHVLGLSLQPKAADYHQKVYDFVRALRGEAAEQS